MNIRKWKDSPALKETRDMLETKLEVIIHCDSVL